MFQLSAIDAIVLVLYVFGIVALGVWLGRGKQDSKRYLLGSNNVPWWAILGSIVATETSTVTFLSVPSFTFFENGDVRFLQLAIGYIVGRTLIVFWLLPLYFRGEIFTAYELLHKRFGSATQKLASLIFLVTRNLGDGLRLFLTALALEATVGWPLPVCTIVIGIATIVFTFLGGMQSVIWNDCIQLVVYMVGGLVAFWLIVGRFPDGIGGMMSFANETGRLRMFDFSAVLTDANTFWAGLIGGAFLTLGTHGTDQMMVQRSLAARSQADAAKALIMSGFVVLIQFALFLFVGIALARFYTEFPPAAPFAKTDGDRVFATYIVTEMPKGIGLVGVLLAAIFSAAMSTLSSSLNSSATAVVTDWIVPIRRDLSDDQVVRLSKILTVVFGVIQIVIGIWAVTFPNSVVKNALSIAGFSSGLLLGLFALGTFLPRTNQTAAVSGLAAGTCMLLLVKFGGPLVLPAESQLAWPWYPVVGSICTFVVAWLVSLRSDGSRTAAI